MREAQFLKQNADKWQEFQDDLLVNQPADVLADRFVQLTDDLAYSKTFYPDSNTTKFLNQLAAQFHQKIYRNKKEKSKRILDFWQFELPLLFKQYHKQFLIAFIFFLIFVWMGVISAQKDESFVRFILGDDYVNMTLANIEKGDPFGVYKSERMTNMFVSIAMNNIKVAFFAYVLGITFSIGSIWLLFSNGIMLGSFQYFFFAKGLGAKSIMVVFIHGTLEISSIVIAGAAGLILGSGLLFPGTFKRSVSITKAAKDGLKIVVGLIPFFVVAAFLESYVTRFTEMPLPISLLILTSSCLFVIWYFVAYPIQLHRRVRDTMHQKQSEKKLENFSQWLTKKLSSE